MPIKVFNTFNNSVAFPHVWTSPQRDGVTLFASAKLFVRLMGVAPRCAAVDKCFELTGNICSVGRGDTDNAVRPLKFCNDRLHIIFLYTFCRLVAASAALTVVNLIIIDADTVYLV